MNKLIKYIICQTALMAPRGIFLHKFIFYKKNNILKFKTIKFWKHVSFLNNDVTQSKNGKGKREIAREKREGVQKSVLFFHGESMFDPARGKVMVWRICRLEAVFQFALAPTRRTARDETIRYGTNA